MKKIMLSCTLLLLFALQTNAQESAIDVKTMVYAIKGADTLRLTKYSSEQIGEQPKPCILFMFGGGFMAGDRNSKTYTQFFNHYAVKGYEVVTIDYRLGLKGADPKMSTKGFVQTLNQTINMAVEDLFDATNFVLEHASQWNVDPKLIVASGSSAGAISVLQAEYNLANRTQRAQVLPEEFRYGGVISFAGAIFSVDGRLKWNRTPSPILMFHGDADSNVPYHKMTLLGLGFYGSDYIAQSLRKQNTPYYFSSFENYAHEIAHTPMTLNRYDIDEFLNKMVKEKQPLIIAKNTVNNNKPAVKKRFSIKDYVNSNFRPR